MNPLRILIIALLLATVGSCGQDTEALSKALAENRKHADEFLPDYELIAAQLVVSPIIWANSDSVRYVFDGKPTTELWQAAKLPDDLRLRISSFIRRHKIGGIFVYGQRVDFGLFGTGISASGVSLGLLVSFNKSQSCDAVVAKLSLSLRGMQCEKLNKHSYLYVHR